MQIYDIKILRIPSENFLNSRFLITYTYANRVQTLFSYTLEKDAQYTTYNF